MSFDLDQGWRRLSVLITAMDTELIAKKRQIIIVIEGDPAVRNSLTFSLEIEGFKVSAYARGQDFLDIAATTAHIDGMIVEYRLDDISGIDLIDQLRERGLEFPIVMLATQPDRSVKRNAERLKIEIVEKPLLGNALVDKLRELIR